MPPKNTTAKNEPRRKYKNIPTALLPSHIEDIDTIAKAENMTRSEVVRRAIEAFAFNYKTDQLDQRQLQIEKTLKKEMKDIRAMLAKATRLSGQALYFATLPYCQGIPKQRLAAPAFNSMYDKSAAWAGQFLQSTAAGQIPTEQLMESPFEGPSQQQPTDQEQ